jgi:hypothetical protein
MKNYWLSRRKRRVIAKIASLIQASANNTIRAIAIKKGAFPWRK